MSVCQRTLLHGKPRQDVGQLAEVLPPDSSKMNKYILSEGSTEVVESARLHLKAVFLVPALNVHWLLAANQDLLVCI